MNRLLCLFWGLGQHGRFTLHRFVAVPLFFLEGFTADLRAINPKTHEVRKMRLCTCRLDVNVCTYLHIPYHTNPRTYIHTYGITYLLTYLLTYLPTVLTCLILLCYLLTCLILLTHILTCCKCILYIECIRTITYQYCTPYMHTVHTIQTRMVSSQNSGSHESISFQLESTIWIILHFTT